MTKFNVAGNVGIAQTVKNATAGLQRPEVKEWLTNVLPGKIKRTESMLERIRTAKQMEEAMGKKTPAPVMQKMLDLLAQGAEMHMHVSYAPNTMRFIAELRQVTDWLEAIPTHSRHFKRMNRMSFDDARAMSDDWHEKLLKLSADADDPDVIEEIEVLETWDDGSRIVELKGPVALLREGNLMGHCVGGSGYVTAVSQQSSRIFSLRDPQNRPHVTIEVRRNSAGRHEAVQIKGKGNRPPIERWAAMVRPFIAENDLIVGYDGVSIGMITLNGKTFASPDAIIDHLATAHVDGIRHNSLGAILQGNVSTVLAMRKNDIGADHRAKLLKIVVDRIAPITTEEETLVSLPDGGSISRYKHRISTTILEALSIDLFKGVENEAAERIGSQLDALLSAIKRNPGHIHMVEFTGGMPTKKVLLDQMAAFSGRLAELAAVRNQVQSARRTNHAEIASRLRRMTAPAGNNRTRTDDRSWAQEATRLRQVAPDAIEQSRSSYSAGAIV